MNRRVMLSLVLLVSACNRSPQRLDEVLPPEVGGRWRRGDLRNASAVPPVIASAKPQDSAEATYTGPGTVRILVFRMTSETSAFELMQKWRQDDGMAAYQGPFFFVAERTGADPAAVMDLLVELKRSGHPA